MREVVENEGVVGIKDVNVYDALFKGEEFLLEYMVDFANGKVGVKIVGSDDPQRTLRKYYRYIKTYR